MLRAARPYLVVLGLLWVLPAVVAELLHVTLPDHNAGGQCEGIGFGCSPTPADTGPLLLVLASPFLLVAGLVGCGVVALVKARRRRTSATSGTSRPAGVTSS